MYNPHMTQELLQPLAKFSLCDGRLKIHSSLSDDSAVLDFSAEHPEVSFEDIFRLNQVAFLAQEIQARVVKFLLSGIPQMTSDSLSQILSRELTTEESNRADKEANASVESSADFMRRLMRAVLLSCWKRLNESESKEISFPLITMLSN